MNLKGPQPSGDDRKVCPSCGFSPWNPDPGHREHQPPFCQECGDKLVSRSELPRDIWKDPNVKCALKEGRQTWDIGVMRCPECGELGYYNEGSHFSCRFCDITFHISGDDDQFQPLRLDDTITECGEGYDNRTL